MRIAAIQGPLEIGNDYIRNLPASKMDQAAPSLLGSRAYNIGDWFVTKIVDRMLDYDELIAVDKDASDSAWDLVNQTCDVLVLKGGNYIQSDWLTKRFGLEVFKKIKIPIVMFGVGLQASPGRPIAFEPEEVEILKYICGSGASSAVRGHRTAEILATLGIHNVVVTGCPTVFWTRQPRLSIRVPDDRAAGFSYRQGLYSRDPDLYRAQFRAIAIVRDRFKSVDVILQGEEVILQHYLQACQWQAEFKGTVQPIAGMKARRLERIPLDRDRLHEEIHTQLDQLSTPSFVDWLMNNTFFSYDILEYLEKYRSKGLVIGCRLHSNLLALANGTPSYFLTYDERTQETVELLNIPSCPLTDFSEEIDLLGQDWSGFEQSFAECYRQMVAFLEMNGLKHRLPPPELQQSDPTASAPTSIETSHQNPLRSTGQLAGQTEMPAVSPDRGTAMMEPTRLFAERPEPVERLISPNDRMYKGNDRHYFGVGYSALQGIKLAMLAADQTEARHILDWPSGHGRVLRMLRAAFPTATLTACDLDRDAVDFCAQTFGALPVYATADPAQTALAGPFELIWCGSLLTHLDAARWDGFLRRFEVLLAPDGILVFSTHGAWVAERLGRGQHTYGLPPKAVAALLERYRRDGFGYGDYAQGRHYGISVAAPAWVCGQLAQRAGLRLLSYQERAWDNHHDIVACVRTDD